jgi:hypothetical protein
MKKMLLVKVYPSKMEYTLLHNVEFIYMASSSTKRSVVWLKLHLVEVTGATHDRLLFAVDFNLNPFNAKKKLILDAV